MVTVYGIPNCDTIKKTQDWLKKNKIEYSFHNYKSDGISKEKLSAWCKKIGWELLLNKKSTTWKSLTPQEQENATTQTAAITIMQQNNSIIKRPVIEAGNVILVGFNETEFIKHLK